MVFGWGEYKFVSCSVSKMFLGECGEFGFGDRSGWFGRRVMYWVRIMGCMGHL